MNSAANSEADRIPPKRRTTWASRVLAEFSEDKRKIIYAEFDSDKTAISKQNALNKELKAEDSPFAGKFNIQRRGNQVYIEKLK